MKKVDEKKRVYLEFTEYGSKCRCGGLNHLKVENKHVQQYENLNNPEHCVVNIFVIYFASIPDTSGQFYFCPLSSGEGVKFAQQPVGRNRFAQIIPRKRAAAGIEGRKTGHSGKVTCATALYQQGFCDQLIRERTGHSSIEALHKYKRTSLDQKHAVSMALLPTCADRGKENTFTESDSDDDFQPLKKVPKLSALRGLFPQSALKNCTFNINIQK